MWKIITDAVPQMIAAGIKYTIPIALVSFAIGLIIALVTALTRISVRKGVLIRIAKGIAVFTFGSFAQRLCWYSYSSFSSAYPASSSRVFSRMVSS